MKREALIFLVLLVTGATGALASTLTLDPSLTQFALEQKNFSYGDWPSITLGQNGSFAAQQFLIELHDQESASDIEITSANQLLLGDISFVDDIPTTDANSYDLSVIRQGYPALSQPGIVIGEQSEFGRRFAEVVLFPYSISANQLFLNENITVTVNGRDLAQSELLPTDRQHVTQLSASSSDVISPNYLIITSEALKSALEPLKQYRIATGYNVQVVTVESIYASTSGVDHAEQIREFLKLHFATPGGYLLLAGDETVVPIRLAYHYTNHSDTAISPVNLQICDLYFADLTGNWDRDHDGTFGERLDDAADITPELNVGRLPFNHSEDFLAYTNKLIGYETNPGADRSWLTRSIFYSSDQMRDLNEGQHNQIASAYPETFLLDTISAVEAERGDDPAPSNLSPAELAPVTEHGFGIVNIIAHGRSDGFVLKSANYNEWPKTIMLTEPVGSHGYLDDMTAEGKPAFYYSLACDNTQFDCDQPYFGQIAPNLSQALLADPNGAIGFVGHSRWGWVGSSYLLQQAFFDSLFAHPDRAAVQAMYGAKAAIYYYRDLVYGLNYLGDPALRIYQTIPLTPTITSEPGNPLTVIVTANGQPLPDCHLILSLADSNIETSVTDQSGRATFVTPLSPSFIYSIAAVKPGYSVNQSYLSGSIVTDVDDKDLLPRQFSLAQNYPNPFNPSTQIRFTLPTRADVSLTIYNLLGQVVAIPLNQEMSAGEHIVSWSAENNAAGVYLYRLTAGEFSETKKMILLK